MKSEKASSSHRTVPIRPKAVGLVVKHRHAEAADLAIRLTQLMTQRGLSVYFADESEALAKRCREGLKPALERRVGVVPKTQLVDKTQLIIVLGGDGTFLSIARQMSRKSIPVLGVNMGQLGFLTEVKKDEIEAQLKILLSRKKALVSERTLLEVTLKRRGKTIFQGPVVNDAVISKGAIARIISLEISVNDRWAHTVRADGIIVSTPTGSTAYSLAAGGPLIEPSLGAMAITPICPHSLTQRPLVLSEDAKIQICLNDEPGHVYLTLDGQDAVDLKKNDHVTIKRFAKHRLQLISSPTRDYFGLLREKLSFGMRA